jgi:glutaconate CoA-transferase subunit B
LRKLVTDLGVLEPDPVSCELTVTALHPEVTRDQIVEATGWALRFADVVTTTAAPSDGELSALHALQVV